MRGKTGDESEEIILSSLNHDIDFIEVVHVRQSGKMTFPFALT